MTAETPNRFKKKISKRFKLLRTNGNYILIFSRAYLRAVGAACITHVWRWWPAASLEESFSGGGNLEKRQPE